MHLKAFKRTVLFLKQKLHTEEQRKEISFTFWEWEMLEKKMCRWSFRLNCMFFGRAQTKIQKGKLLGEVWT